MEEQSVHSRDVEKLLCEKYLVDSGNINNAECRNHWTRTLLDEKVYSDFCNDLQISVNAPLDKFVSSLEEKYFADARKLTMEIREKSLNAIYMKLFAHSDYAKMRIYPSFEEEGEVSNIYLKALYFLFERKRKEDLIRNSGADQLSEAISRRIIKNLSQVIDLKKISLEPLWEVLCKYLPLFLNDGFFVAILPYFVTYHIAYCSYSNEPYNAPFQDAQDVLKTLWRPIQHFETADNCRFFCAKRANWVQNIRIPIDTVYNTVQLSLNEVFCERKIKTMGSALKEAGYCTGSFPVCIFSHEHLIDLLSKYFNLAPERRGKLKSEWDRIYNNWAKSGSYSPKAQEVTKQEWNESVVFNHYDNKSGKWLRNCYTLGEFLELLSVAQSPNYFLGGKEYKDMKALALYENSGKIMSDSDLIVKVFRKAGTVVNVSDVLFEEMAWPVRKQNMLWDKERKWFDERSVTSRAVLRKELYMKLSDLACKPIEENQVKKHCGYSISSFDRAFTNNRDDTILMKMTELLRKRSNSNSKFFFAAFSPKVEETWKKMIQVLNEQHADTEGLSLQELCQNSDLFKERKSDEIDDNLVDFYRKMNCGIHEITNCPEEKRESNYTKLIRIYLAIELTLHAENIMAVNKLEKMMTYLLG